MCGVTGILDLTQERDEEIERRAAQMVAAIRHRGPDELGTWSDRECGIALAHSRLAIMDPSAAGRQPMVSKSGRFIVAFNGEVYNFQGLRGELEGRGHTFIGHSDTEVLLACFAEWGLASTLPRLDGMFALALWDRSRRVLHLARDRFGEKPMYYGWCGRVFLFGSELKAIRAHPAFDSELDRDALALFLRYAYVPEPWSIFDHIRKLPPATSVSLSVSTHGAMPAPSTYWNADERVHDLAGTFDGSFDECVDAADELLGRSVRNRMLSDVPLGAFLSGGIDSSAVVSKMQEAATAPVRTFTIGFDDLRFDESVAAAEVSAHLGTHHTQLIASADDAMQVIPDLATIYDEPFADSSQIPSILVSRLAREHVTVALSGDGGDEVFGGYNRHSWVPSVWTATGRVPSTLRRVAGAAVERIHPSFVDAVAARMNGHLPARLRQRIAGDKVRRLGTALRAATPQEMYWNLVSHWSPSEVVLGATDAVSGTSALRDWPNLDLAAALMFLDATTYLPGDILAKVDRASMSVGLEVRTPFLDHRLVEFAWSLPLEMRLHSGIGKRPVREIARRGIPSDLVERPKMGFGIPIGDWLRGPLRDWAEDLLSAERLGRDGYLAPGPIREAWSAHLSGRSNRHYELWDVLMFQSWLEGSSGPAPYRIASALHRTEVKG
jgi:asparagine synthase (glutamine-hydrolysing)